LPRRVDHLVGGAQGGFRMAPQIWPELVFVQERFQCIGMTGGTGDGERSRRLLSGNPDR
jgi:hypothetical protein